MLVYGDRSRVVATGDLIDSIAAALDEARRARSWWARRDAAREALIQSGELAQGIADAEFERRGCDHPSDTQEVAMNLVMAAAKGLHAAWRGVPGGGPPPAGALSALRRRPPPDRVVCRSPEGFDFYAVYPESYVALGARRWPSRPLVIGLRSIGTTLSACVAAGAGAATPITLRPHGAPFDRKLSVSPELRRRLSEHDGPYLVVDEGPGLSGSSFGAVGDLLESLGVDPERIVYLPSHAGEPGVRASAAHLARWRRARRCVHTFDDLLADQPVETWFSDLIGPARTVEDLSGGAWRDDLPERRRPPTWSAQERRKFRLTTASGLYLARFAGLGSRGTAKFAAARRLHAAGFVPEPLALRGGLLLERWIAPPAEPPAAPSRPAFLAHLGRYLRFRARSLPATAGEGAGLEALSTMGLVNARVLGGEGLGHRLEPVLSALRGGAPALRPIWTDSRLHAWEWLCDANGRWLKADALDHARAHDLVGCQDVAWDVAGAAVEFDLTGGEIADLAAAAGADVAVIPAFTACYLAFQAAYWTMAEGSAAPADATAIRRLRDRRLAALRVLSADYLAAGS